MTGEMEKRSKNGPNFWKNYDSLQCCDLSLAPDSNPTAWKGRLFESGPRSLLPR